MDLTELRFYLIAVTKVGYAPSHLPSYIPTIKWYRLEHSLCSSYTKDNATEISPPSSVQHNSHNLDQIQIYRYA